MIYDLSQVFIPSTIYSLLLPRHFTVKVAEAFRGKWRALQWFISKLSNKICSTKGILLCHNVELFFTSKFSTENSKSRNCLDPKNVLQRIFPKNLYCLCECVYCNCRSTRMAVNDCWQHNLFDLLSTKGKIVYWSIYNKVS